MNEKLLDSFGFTDKEKLEFGETKQKIRKLKDGGYFNGRVDNKAVQEGLEIDKHGIVYDGRGVA
jgi:hypothetical protein